MDREAAQEEAGDRSLSVAPGHDEVGVSVSGQIGQYLCGVPGAAVGQREFGVETFCYQFVDRPLERGVKTAVIIVEDWSAADTEVFLHMGDDDLCTGMCFRELADHGTQSRGHDRPVIGPDNPFEHVFLPNVTNGWPSWTAS